MMRSTIFLKKCKDAQKIMIGNNVMEQKTELSLVKYFLKNLVIFNLGPWGTFTLLLSSNSVFVALLLVQSLFTGL